MNIGDYTDEQRDYFVHRIAKKMVQAEKENKEFLTTTPSDVIGEILLNVLDVAKGDIEIDIETSEYVGVEEPRKVAIAALSTAQPMLIDYDSWNLILDMTLPDDYQHEASPFDCIYITWPGDLVNKDGRKAYAMVLIVSEEVNRVGILSFVYNEKEDKRRLNFSAMENIFGTPYASLDKIGKAFINLLVYMNNKEVLEVAPMKTTHTEARKLKKLKIKPPEVSCVKLPGYLRKQAKTQATGTGAKLSCRFMVRGHYRNQWYPSEGTHKLKWIKPFIKGSEDKPFKEKVYKL